MTPQTEALKQARSVISSINQGKQHALTRNEETVFWQREEWVRWALDEVLPLIDEALAQPEQDWIERKRAVGYREGHQNALKQMAQPEQEPVASYTIDYGLLDCVDNHLYKPPTALRNKT